HTCRWHIIISYTSTPTTYLPTLSLHDALPIWPRGRRSAEPCRAPRHRVREVGPYRRPSALRDPRIQDGKEVPESAARHHGRRRRSEEHTSELQSHLNLVCRLLLEKKNHYRSKV